MLTLIIILILIVGILVVYKTITLGDTLVDKYDTCKEELTSIKDILQDKVGLTENYYKTGLYKETKFSGEYGIYFHLANKFDYIDQLSIIDYIKLQDEKIKAIEKYLNISFTPKKTDTTKAKYVKLKANNKTKK